MTALYKILPMAIMQSAMLAGGQVFLKLAMVRMKPFAWTWSFFGSLLTNWPFAACGLCFLFASLLWMHMLKVFPLLGISFVVIELRLRHAGCHRLLS